MYMLCCYRIFVVQRTVDVGSKFHCTIWCADRMKIDTRPYWFELMFVTETMLNVLFFCLARLSNNFGVLLQDVGV